MFKSILTVPVAVATVLPAHSALATKPNILFVIADDLTYRDIGCYGGQALTPHIDKLATEGMRFNRCFQTMPILSPTRHTIHTRLYPVKSGTYTNHLFAHDQIKSIGHHIKRLRGTLDAWMSDQGDKGMQTERSAIERMHSGNAGYKA
jgi:uncharacterized sulfatase